MIEISADFDFNEFMESKATEITGYCAAITGSADAQDAAQEAFIRLWNNLSKIDGCRKASGYLYRAAYSACMDILRKRKKYYDVDTVGERKSNGGLSDKTQRALMRLKAQDRAIVYLRIWQELDYEEIGNNFGHNAAWARKRYSLALKKLSKILNEQ